MTRIEKRKKYNLHTQAYVALGVVPSMLGGLVTPSLMVMVDADTTLSEGFATTVQSLEMWQFVFVHGFFAISFGVLAGAFIHAYRNRISGPAYD